jgi:hypothetical protein
MTMTRRLTHAIHVCIEDPHDCENICKMSLRMGGGDSVVGAVVAGLLVPGLYCWLALAPCCARSRTTFLKVSTHNMNDMNLKNWVEAFPRPLESHRFHDVCGFIFDLHQSLCISSLFVLRGCVHSSVESVVSVSSLSYLVCIQTRNISVIVSIQANVNS